MGSNNSMSFWLLTFMGQTPRRLQFFCFGQISSHGEFFPFFLLIFFFFPRREREREADVTSDILIQDSHGVLTQKKKNNPLSTLFLGCWSLRTKCMMKLIFNYPLKQISARFGMKYFVARQLQLSMQRCLITFVQNFAPKGERSWKSS